MNWDKIEIAYTVERRNRFIEHNYQMIAKLCANRARGWPISVEDLTQKVCEDICRNFRYDPSKGAPSTWVYNRVRKVFSKMLGKRDRTPTDTAASISDEPVSRKVESRRASANQQAMMELKGVLGRLDDIEAAVVGARVNGLRGSEAIRATGMTARERLNVIRKIREREGVRS